MRKIFHRRRPFFSNTNRLWLLSLFVILLTSAVIAAQEPEQHLIRGEGWNNKPVTPAALQQRIETAAVQYAQYAPVARVAFYDIAFPRNADEYSALDGYAVLLITALSQEQTELPLKKVYVRADGKEIELKQISAVLSKQSNASDQAAKTFGAYRVDALYLLPVHLHSKNGDLVIDFAKNRDGFKLAEFSPEAASPLGSLPNKPPVGAAPAEAALMRFIEREYPGFVKKQ